MNETYKLMTIRSGDVITYYSTSAGRRVSGVVSGWRTTCGRPHVLVAGGAQQVSLEKVQSRHRARGDGAGTIVYEDEQVASLAQERT